LAGYLARDELLESAAPAWAVVCVVGIAYLTYRTSQATSQSELKRKERNAYLVEQVQANQLSAPSAPPADQREVDPRTLRFVQWIIEAGLADFNDWTHHDVIDQFQTAAIRYQLYEIVYSLSIYQCHYVPNFHGYLGAAQRNAIEKSCTQKVMNFWKWESLVGKFNAHDWDPIKKDNIVSECFSNAGFV
jgi:Linalool dehydratase/isomerase